MPTAHYTTRRDTTRQLPTGKLCNVRGGGGVHDTTRATRQKSDLVVSDLTMLDICDKARFLSCRVASSRRPPHNTRFSFIYAHRTLHDTTRRDTTRQHPTGKLCNVRGVHDTTRATRQKSDLVVSDLTMLDICDKARFLYCRVASSRRPPHITRFSCPSCRVVSRRVMCGGHYREKAKTMAIAYVTLLIIRVLSFSMSLHTLVI